MIEVSAGVISAPDGRILICRRGEGRSNAHLWEFPGGKREEGESAADCLVRELMEELSLPVTDVREEAEYPHGNIRFTFLTAKTDALPILTEHEDARFVRPRELLHFDFCPADVMMARRLAFRLVRHIFWDFDGTLLDSMRVWRNLNLNFLRANGVNPTPQQEEDMLNLTGRMAVDYAREHFHVDVTFDQLAEHAVGINGNTGLQKSNERL